MTTQTWHADHDLVAAYVAGRLDAITGASVEQHLTRCAPCRDLVRTVTDLPALERAWSEVRSRIESPPPPLFVRLARRVGLPEPTGVLLAATASLRTAWLVSVFVALTFALGATHFAQDLVLWPFLLLAPLMPVLGVATAYRSSQDPLETLILTTPYGRARLVLVRTVAVVAVCVPLAGVLGLMLPGPSWVAAAWLGPALCLLPVQLALASFSGPRLASGIVALGWSGLVAGSVRTQPATWPVEPQQQLVVLALALAACLVLAVRAMRTRTIGAVL